MKRLILVCCFTLALLTSGARGLDLNFDLPFDIGFQIGFNTYVVPSEADMSGELGLGVAVDQIITDKLSTLTINGRITNYSSVPCEGVTMRFAVSSYIGTGTTKNTAFVEPSSIAPGGTAAFKARILLDSINPYLAMYTITAVSPALFHGATEYYQVPEYHQAPEQTAEPFVSPAPEQLEGEYLTLDELEPVQ